MSTTFIDSKQIESILQLDRAEMTSVILSIFETIPEDVNHLIQAKSVNNREQVSFIAHKIRGEASSFGLIALSELFAKIEESSQIITTEEVHLLLKEALIINSKSKDIFKDQYQNQNINDSGE